MVLNLSKCALLNHVYFLIQYPKKMCQKVYKNNQPPDASLHRQQDFFRVEPKFGEHVLAKSQHQNIFPIQLPLFFVFESNDFHLNFKFINLKNQPLISTFSLTFIEQLKSDN